MHPCFLHNPEMGRNRDGTGQRRAPYHKEDLHAAENEKG